MTDTPAQKRTLRSNPAARRVRARFPEGTRVVSIGGMTGTVVRHIPHLSALGGVVRVRWDEPKFGVETSTVTPTVIQPMEGK